MASQCGSFAVTLRTIRWRHAPNETLDHATSLSPSPPPVVWASVTLAPASSSSDAAQLLDGVWFDEGDENAMTTTVELSRDAPETQFAYAQSSRPLALSTAALTALLHAHLIVSVYSGATQSRTTDELWGETRVAFMPALLGERLHETVRIVGTNAASGEEIALELSAQCDAALADLALGARVLRVHSLRIARPPSDWTLSGATDDDDAMRLCTALDRNTAVYELELPLPDFRDDASTASDVVRFGGGRLTYEPHPSGRSQADSSTLTGEWSIVFPAATAVVHKLYAKPTVSRLIDFLEVEKVASAVLRRSNVDAPGRVTATAVLNLHDLASPGQMRVDVDTPLKKITPLPKEALEQELAGAISNDEKKRLQALITDYDAVFVQATAALSSSIRVAKTRVQCVVEIVGHGPLVLEPPATPTPIKSIDELVPPRDLTEEYDQRRDVTADLRTEIRRVVLTVLREYEDAESTTAIAGSRDEKRQRIVFALNSQGAYHEFKEKLKKRIVPMIRDQFADELHAAPEHASEDGDEDEHETTPVAEPQHPHGLDVKATGSSPVTRVNAQKKAFFASVYATLMDEVQRVLHETFYPSSASVPPSSQTLETTHADLQARDDVKVTRTLEVLGLRALENEVNGDVDKSEALHLDRIAFAEARSVEMPQLASALHPTLGRVWFDYATFNLGQGELDKAGAALRQCLSLEPHAVDALIAYGALLCELHDFTAADIAIKNAVSEALQQQQQQQQSHGAAAASALERLATAHALLALYFARSRTDETGNLVQFELLKAQRALRQLRQCGRDGHPDQSTESSSATEPCLSSAWLHLAAALHALRLRSGTQTVLQLADEVQRPRDVLSRDERVLKRALLADVLSLRGDGDRATALLEEALEIDRTHAFAWFVLGKTYLQLESQSDTAITCLQRSLERKQTLRSDQRLSLYVHLGLVLLQTSQFALAKATFLSACDEFPVASTWLGVGIASLRLEQRDAAQVALAEANRLDPTSAEVWGYLALLALSAVPRVTRQHEQRARQCVAQATRFQLSNPALLRELSSGFVAIDRLEDAERLLRRALVFQDSSLTRKTLADVLAAQNCAEDALAQYKQSLDESHAGDVAQRSELLAKCAALLVTLGRPDEAAECRRMAAQLQDPDMVASDNGDPERQEVA